MKCHGGLERCKKVSQPVGFQQCMIAVRLQRRGLPTPTTCHLSRGKGSCIFIKPVVFSKIILRENLVGKQDHASTVMISIPIKTSSSTGQFLALMSKWHRESFLWNICNGLLPVRLSKKKGQFSESVTFYDELV